MSFLFWAFLAGGLTVAFPLVFHLIRRTPKGQQTFSSLMFLRPTPPRLTRRSRLDDLLLLLLRVAAILLLVAAFMRPYWRAAADLSLDNVRGRRVAVVLDTSASMRRGDLWQQAIVRANETVDGLSPADDIALFTYDRQTTELIAFDENETIDHGDKLALAKDQLSELKPTWYQSDLGGSLVRVAEVLGEAEGDTESDLALQVVLITDLQTGSDLGSLEVFEWPEHVRVTLEQVSLADNSNATALLLQPSGDEDDRDSTDPRVRVTNSSDSSVDQFQVYWEGQQNDPADRTVAFYVPPGQSRVLAVPRSAKALAATRLIVSGDSVDFDNTQYVVPIRQRTVRLAYLGSDDRNDPDGMRFYLERAFGETAERKVEFIGYAADESISLLPTELPELMVITHAVPAAQVKSVRKYIAAGGSALVVLSRESIESLGALLPGVSLDEQQFPADEADYRMLGEIDFGHPLFATFANPRYNDFTNIRFWSYCPVTLSDAGEAAEVDVDRHLLAHFDNGKPAVWQQQAGKGKYFVFASGWHPAESQLALSNKFVPLMEEIVELSTRRKLDETSYTVGDRVPLPDAASEPNRKVIGPDATEYLLTSTDASFTATDQPGIYSLELGGVAHTFAVNLARAESNTAPLGSDRLEQLGVKLGVHRTQAEEYDRLRQLRDIELEQRQKLWKWLIVAALVALALETGVSGWRAQRNEAHMGESK